MPVCLSDHRCNRSHVIEHFLRNAVQNSFIGMGMCLCRNLAQSCRKSMKCACGRCLKRRLITHILLCDHRPYGVQNTGDEAADRIPYCRDHIGNCIHYCADSGRDRIPNRLKKGLDALKNDRYDRLNGLPCCSDLFVDPVHNTGNDHMDRFKNRLKQILERL